MGTPLTKEQALNYLIGKFPNLDFSKFEFIDRCTDSIVICKEHGEFLSNYRLMYLKTYPCPECMSISRKKKNSISKDQALSFLNIKYTNNEIQDFDYEGYNTKITITCKKHNISNTRTYKDLYFKIKHHCYMCIQESKETKTYNTEEVLKYIKEKFPKYIVPDEFKFIGVDYHFKLICPEHGEFETSVYKIMKNKHICVYCSGKKIKDPVGFLQNKYPNLDFSKFVYKNNQTKSIIVCPTHGEFEASYHNLKKDKSIKGCLECSINYKAKNKTLDEKLAIERLKNKFTSLDFSKFKYINHRNKSIVICKKHGEFESSYGELIHCKDVIYGCRKCSNVGYSKSEKEIVDYIKSFYSNIIIENDRSIIKNEYTNRFLELDIYLPDIKLAIEFNGTYWHSDKMKCERKGFNTLSEIMNYKSNECNKLGITLLHISEEEYINNKDKVLNNIKNKIEEIK